MLTHQCSFWDCYTDSEPEEAWCREHLLARRRGLVDDCPRCGAGKYRRYSICLRCLRAATAYPWEPDFPVPSMNREFHVYVLQLDDGGFFAGYSSDLELRLMEHREGSIPATRGLEPRLAWFTTVESRGDAEALKARIRALCRNDSREMLRRLLWFRGLVRQLPIPVVEGRTCQSCPRSGAA